MTQNELLTYVNLVIEFSGRNGTKQQGVIMPTSYRPLDADEVQGFVYIPIKNRNDWKRAVDNRDWAKVKSLEEGPIDEEDIDSTRSLHPSPHQR